MMFSMAVMVFSRSFFKESLGKTIVFHGVHFGFQQDQVMPQLVVEFFRQPASFLVFSFEEAGREKAQHFLRFPQGFFYFFYAP